jgi:hypothetical protein
MTQRQGGTSVLTERDHVDQPVAVRESEEAAAHVAEPRRNRRPMLLIAVVAAALIALAIAAALTGSNPEPADVTPQERPNALVEPVGSDQHLLNQAARVSGGGDVKAVPYMYAAGNPFKDPATKQRFQAPRALGSDQHLENQAAKLAG